MTLREAIVAEARTWIGTRFKHQASCKGAGVDCIGLIAGVAEALGIPEAKAFRDDVRFRGYGKTPDPVALRQAVAEYLDPVEVAQPGDILLLRNERDPQPSHFAFVSSPTDYMIHAYAQMRRVAEHRIDAAWRGRILSCYAFRGLS